MRKFLLALAFLPLWGYTQAEVKEVCFSPYGNCSEVIQYYVQSTTHTLDLALYSLTNDDIAQTIIKLHNQGVQVRLVIDRIQSSIKKADDDKLEAAGIPVKRMNGLKGGLMHHKFAIIDGKLLFTGSYNWTRNGNDKNSENLLLLDDTEVIQKYQKEFETLWSAN